MSEGASSTAPGGRRRGPAKPAARPSKPLEVLRQELVETYAVVGLGLMQFRPLTATVVTSQAEACADAWVAAAEAFPAIRRVLETVGKSTIPLALVSAHLPIWIALAVEQGQMPVEHPWAQRIRPHIDHEIARQQAAAADRARREAEAQGVDIGAQPAAAE